MKITALLLAAAAVLGLAAGAAASDSSGQVLDSLDLCSAQGNSHYVIATDRGCVRVSGGISYRLQWGDYKSGGSGSTGAGQLIVQTPADDYTIPAPPR